MAYIIRQIVNKSNEKEAKRNEDSKGASVGDSVTVMLHWYELKRCKAGLIYNVYSSVFFCIKK